MPEKNDGIFFISVLSRRQEVSFPRAWWKKIWGKPNQGIISEKISLCRLAMYRSQGLLPGKRIFSPIIPMDGQRGMTIGPLLYKGHIAWENRWSLEAFPEFCRRVYQMEKRLNRNHIAYNLNPGYLHKDGVFLASRFRDFHKIYIGQGIYLSWQMQFIGKNTKMLAWSFPEYGKTDFILFFEQLRGKFQTNKGTLKRE